MPEGSGVGLPPKLAAQPGPPGPQPVLVVLALLLVLHAPRALDVRLADPLPLLLEVLHGSLFLLPPIHNNSSSDDVACASLR